MWPIIIFHNPIFNESISSNNDLLFKIISSIDLFLIGIVLLIFGFGVYELFISEIDFAKTKFSVPNPCISTVALDGVRRRAGLGRGPAAARFTGLHTSQLAVSLRCHRGAQGCQALQR